MKANINEFALIPRTMQREILLIFYLDEPYPPMANQR